MSKNHWQTTKLLNFQKFITPRQVNSLSELYHKAMSKALERYESHYPRIVTDSLPGPRQRELNDRLQSITGLPNSGEIFSLGGSFGNYLEDADGNQILDMFMNRGFHSLGYNHRNLLRYTQLEHFQRNTANELHFLSADYPKLLATLARVAPYEVPDIQLCSDSTALSRAVDLALSHSGKTKVVTFEGATPVSQATTVRLPEIRYPYEDNYNYNQSQEEASLGRIEGLIREDREIGVLVVEPVVYSSMRYCSHMYYRNLRDICKRNQVKFIIDETNTGGWVSGRALMHSAWNLESPADVVVFGGRLQVSGFFHSREFRESRHQAPDAQPANLMKLQKFNLLNQFVYHLDWLDLHASTFLSSMRTEFHEIQRRRSSDFRMSNFRGVGKMWAFDVDHELLRDEILYLAYQRGFKLVGLGENSLGFTPSLLFTEVHFSYFKEFMLGVRPTSTYMSRI